MKLKIFLYSLILIIAAFFLFSNVVIINKDSKTYTEIKKKLTGIYHYLGLYNLKSPPEKNDSLTFESSEIISANNFDLKITQLENFNYEGKSAALFIDSDNKISLFHQEGYIIKNNLFQKISLTKNFTLEKHGGLKGVFNVNNEYYGLVSSRTINCYKSSIVSLDKNNTIFETACLPTDHLIDYNSIGGANFVENDNLYLSIGTPEMYSQKIRKLAQDDNHHYGKILKININEFAKSELENVEIFSKGHRNPQGLISYDNLILSTEHGPYGGDEINIINSGSNYGWPISSYGTKYSKNDDEGSELGESFQFDHKSNDFKEPIYAFIPSEAISDLVKCPSILIEYYKKPCLILTSLKAGSLFVVLLNDDMNSILSIEKILIGIRLRHFAKYKNNYPYDGKDHIYITGDQEGVLKISFENFR